MVRLSACGNQSKDAKAVEKLEELKTSASLVKDESRVSVERQRSVKELNRLADTVERLCPLFRGLSCRPPGLRLV